MTAPTREELLAKRLRAAAESFESQRAWHANAVDGDCEPHDSWQLEMEDASKAAIEAAELIEGLPAAEPPVFEGDQREALEKIAAMDLLALAAGLEDNLCHKHCACHLEDGPKDCIQERAAKVLRAFYAAPQPQHGGMGECSKS